MCFVHCSKYQWLFSSLDTRDSPATKKLRLIKLMRPLASDLASLYRILCRFAASWGEWSSSSACNIDSRHELKTFFSPMHVVVVILLSSLHDTPLSLFAYSLFPSFHQCHRFKQKKKMLALVITKTRMEMPHQTQTPPMSIQDLANSQHLTLC
jgi:hypothetical protein